MNELMPFQEAGVEYLANNRQALLYDEPGLGKTVQAVMSWEPDAPVLVVCPAGVREVWRLMVEQWVEAPNVTVVKKKSEFRYPTSGEVVVVSYEAVPLRPEPAPPYIRVVFDEAHYLKNPKADRTKRCKQVSRAALSAGGSSHTLTGTPILNRPTDLWNILSFNGLQTRAYGSWPEFLRMFRGKPAFFGGFDWGVPLPEAAERLRRVALGRRREDVLPELPRKRYETFPCELDGTTRRYLDALLKESGGIDKLEQVLSQKIAFDTISTLRATLAMSKLPTLLLLLDLWADDGHPTVVFSDHRAPIVALGHRPGWDTVLGGDDFDNVTQAIKNLQDNDGATHGIAGTITGPLGVGVTLTASHRVVFIDRSFTPALNTQAEDRLCRIGQLSAVQVVDLVSDHPVDRLVYRMLTAKNTIIDASVNAAASAGAVPQTPSVYGDTAILAAGRKPGRVSKRGAP